MRLVEASAAKKAKDDPRWGRRLGVRLWTFNRFLRWTGFRVFIERRNTPFVPDQWTIGLVFWGWRFVWEGEELAQWQR